MQGMGARDYLLATIAGMALLALLAIIVMAK
jgi:hypothetical protein